jgi:SAM-dependent methyltransferase
MNKPDPDTDQIESLTLEHYNRNSTSFREGTKDHDVSQNYHSFLSQFGDGQNLDILDFGCGPGRDLFYFRSLGHRPIGLDGSEEFCQMARQYSGCAVLHQKFLDLTLPNSSFDGVFANASLFHVPGRDLPKVLSQIHTTLRPNGILFMSNPRGEGEGWSGERYGHYMEYEISEQFLDKTGFTVLDYYYRPAGKPLHQQPWLAIVSQRVDSQL